MGLMKAKFIVHGVKDAPFNVLFNPAEYQISSTVNYAERPVPGMNNAIVQFISGQNDSLSLTLHLDSYMVTRVTQPGDDNDPPQKPQDIRKTVAQFLQMLNMEGALHAPPQATFSWGSLAFRGVVQSMQHTYTMFMEDGIPVRARLDLQMKAVVPPDKDVRTAPRESPDRTKSRVLIRGSHLWHLASQEYDDPAMWRVIAEANGIDNPRLPLGGVALKVPALPASGR